MYDVVRKFFLSKGHSVHGAHNHKRIAVTGTFSISSLSSRDQLSNGWYYSWFVSFNHHFMNAFYCNSTGYLRCWDWESKEAHSITINAHFMLQLIFFNNFHRPSWNHTESNHFFSDNHKHDLFEKGSIFASWWLFYQFFETQSRIIILHRRFPKNFAFSQDCSL